MTKPVLLAGGSTLRPEALQHGQLPSAGSLQSQPVMAIRQTVHIGIVGAVVLVLVMAAVLSFQL